MAARARVGTDAIYARYSSELQNPRSIDDQVSRLRVEIERRSGRLGDDLVFTDAEMSGAVWERPGLQDLLRAMNDGRVRRIFIEDVSRISRDKRDLAELEAQAGFAGVRLVFVADGIELDGSSGASLAYGVKSVLSSAYLYDLGDKTRRGLQGNAREGKATGGRTYGYRTKDDRSVEVLEEEAQIVRRIFESYARGNGYATIAIELNDDRVPPPRTKRRAGIGWMASCIREMLRNPKYVGRWTFGKRKWLRHPDTRRRVARVREEADHNVMRADRPDLIIVDLQLWDVVQLKLQAHADAYKRKNPTGTNPSGVPRHRTDYLLSSLLRCASCGGLMQLSGGTPHRYYRCVANRKSGTCANRLSVKEATARERILGAIRESLSTPAAVAHIRKRVAERLGEVGREVDSKAVETEKRLARTEERIKNLIAMQLDGDRSPYLAEMRRDLEAQATTDRLALESLRARAAAPLRLPDAQVIGERVQSLDALLRGEAVERGREALRRYLKGGAIRLHPGPDGVYTAQAELLPLGAILEAETPPALGQRRCLHPVARGGNDVWTTAVVVPIHVRLTA